MRVREVLKMRKMLGTSEKLEKIIVLCFRYIVMRKNNLRRHKDEEKEKTG
jgi:hypothetical protein